jgi:hypothetical protein
MAYCAGDPHYFGSKAVSLARLIVVCGVFTAVVALVPDKARSQDAQGRLTQRFGVQQRPRPVPVPAPASPTVESTSALGQALAACEKDAAVQDTFALPGLKNEVTLDRCYKGRAHLVCVFNALIAEAKSLTDSYTKVVDAKYPDISSVDGICKLNREALTNDITGSEDFTERFAVLTAIRFGFKMRGHRQASVSRRRADRHGATPRDSQIHDRLHRQRHQPGVGGAKPNRRALRKDGDFKEGDENPRQDSSNNVHQGKIGADRLERAALEFDTGLGRCGDRRAKVHSG